MEPGFSVLGLGVGDIYIFLIPYSVPTCYTSAVGSTSSLVVWGSMCGMACPSCWELILHVVSRPPGCRAVRALLESLQPQAPPLLEPLQALKCRTSKARSWLSSVFVTPAKGDPILLTYVKPLRVVSSTLLPSSSLSTPVERIPSPFRCA